MGYKKTVLQGVGWFALWRVITRILAFAKIAIIARILAPSDYGLFGIATLVLVFLELLTETGINVFFVQGEAEIEDYISTAWVVSIVRGLLISLLIIISTPLVIRFFSTPTATKLLFLVALVPLVRGFINPAIVTLQKDLRFQADSLYKISLFIVESLATVGFVYILRSPIGLIWGMIISSLYDLFISFVIVHPRPKLEFEYQKARHIVGRGKWMTISFVSKYLFEQGDDLLVGRILGTSPLGVYQMAYKISTLPITELSDVVRRVTFPVFSKFSNDKNRLLRAYLKSTALVTLLAVPFGALIFLFPQQIVMILLGEKWLEVAGLLPILIIYGVSQSIISNYSALFLASKKQEFVALVTSFSVLVMAISIFPLISSLGLIGAAWAPLIGTLASYPLIIYLLFRKILK